MRPLALWVRGSGGSGGSAGSGGYGRWSKAAVEALKAAGAEFEFVEKGDPGVTGNFEVKVDGELLHSKRTRNQGFLHQNKETFEAVLKKLSGEQAK
mmetsp:Transcript_69507/g.226379  ORF Transcript_69507/g.226379 Transcript_69507/m.226379 type:complete len:96 (+) Transcript_69507:127-414(+)